MSKQNEQFANTYSYKLIYIFGIDYKTHKGCLKIGETTIKFNGDIAKLTNNCELLNNSAHARIRKETNTAGIDYHLFHTELAITEDNNVFGEKEHKNADAVVREVLYNSGLEKKWFEKNNANEWVICDLETAKNAIIAVKLGYKTLSGEQITTDRTPIMFRPEQIDAIEKTKKRFGKLKGKRMLWNAKMRFGKTLSALQVVKDLQFQKTIIITHRPVVDTSWHEDFNKIFYDTNYRYIPKGQPLPQTDEPFIYFASIQDLRGSSKVGGKFDKGDIVFSTNWDLIIVDEAHEGTQTLRGDSLFNELIKENTKTLELSGTPFNLLEKKDYTSDEVYTWDYVMEQQEKANWTKNHYLDSNPYADLPQMNIFTYDIGDIFTNTKYQSIEDKAFNFAEFFRVWTGDINKDKAQIPSEVYKGKFIHENDIMKFLTLLTRQDDENNYPFSNEDYRKFFKHSLWLVPGVKEAKALSKLLQDHEIFSQFGIANVAGDGDEEVSYDNALKLVQDTIKKHEYTITLSCGKLTTGVTVPEWTTILYLAGSYSTSASSYMQTIFRVQTPACIDGKVKDQCYVFDFAPDRTLKMIAEAGSLSVKAGAIRTEDEEKQMKSFLQYCPVIAISGGKMLPYDVPNMMKQIKKAYVARVVQSGFDHEKLYNDKLLELNDEEKDILSKLKEVIGTTKKRETTNELPLAINGLDGNLNQTTSRTVPTTKKEKDERKAERDKAIKILRGISIRIPLLIYGAEIPFKDNITLDNFSSFVDDKSWEEFMPHGVTKEVFAYFSRYYDKDIFEAAGHRIRAIVRGADELTIGERIKQLGELFAIFRNPDKETILTPWRVVNMHLGDCIGGFNFYKENYKEMIDENESPRFIQYPYITNDIFSQDESLILEINSKTGLYPLYMAYSTYYNKLINVNKKLSKEESELTEQKIWKSVVENNIFVIAKTKMAKSITQRTLCGFTDVKANIICYDNIIEDLKNCPQQFIDKITNPQTWNKKENEKMKFNAIVGNPPYQETLGQTETQTQGNSTWIYYHFQNAVDRLGRYNSLIYPFGGWFDDTDAFNGFGKKILSDKHTVMIKAFEGTSDKRAWYRTDKQPDPFFNVNLSAGVAYLLRDSSVEHEQYTYYNRVYSDKTKVVNVSQWESVTLSPDFTIGDKLFGNKLVNRIKKGCFGIESDFVEKNPDKVSHNNNDWQNPIILLTNDKSGSSGRATKYWADRSVITKGKELIDEYKVITTSAYPKQKFSSGMPTVTNVKLRLKELIEILPIGSAFGRSKMCLFHSPNKQHCDNFIKYTQTNFFALLVLNEPNRSSSIGYVIPDQDFTEQSDIDWTKSVAEIDKQLYEKYNLSEEEINFIETNIKEMK